MVVKFSGPPSLATPHQYTPEFLFFCQPEQQLLHYSWPMNIHRPILTGHEKLSFTILESYLIPCIILSKRFS
jgi:hypothetical protein